MAEKEFLSEFQENLTKTIWHLIVWCLIGSIGWGIKTALQVNHLASLASSASENIRVLETKVEGLSTRLTIIETQLKNTSVQ